MPAACAPHGDGPAHMRQAESTVFQAQTEVIPHGRADEATPVPVPPPTVEDEPCDPQTPIVEKRPIKKGKIKRTAGTKPSRKTGDVAAVDPFAL